MPKATDYSKGSNERERLRQARESGVPWRKWGPYLSERQWGTVREDYSASGDAWNDFTHDQARSRAYRWGEDGLGGISDDKQKLCFALALWNGKDPILKERAFGLTNSEGNHGEDVKEYYFYLDSTPTHSYMKYLYKYPQSAYPYDKIVQVNRHRGKKEPEYELLDTGVFDDDRYFDVFVEYAKASPEDTCIRISVSNRGPEEAELHVLPTMWFRNNWASWQVASSKKPVIKEIKAPAGTSAVKAANEVLGDYYLYCEGDAPLLFTDNETNNKRLFPGQPNASRYVKDGINNYIVHGQKDAVNPGKTGTKVSAHYKITVGGGKTKVLCLRLTSTPVAGKTDPFGSGFDKVFIERMSEADEFYKSIIPGSVSKDEANVMRQALAGMLWSKQYFYFDVDKWLKEHNVDPLDHKARMIRNKEWFHMVNDNVISMPDKWEYPWYAAWDLAFHTRPLSIVDPDFAKEQLGLMLQETYMHPNGQIPAYEWNFSDVNPPVHAWATNALCSTMKGQGQDVDTDFLKKIYRKLLMNFTWWVNRKDRSGKNVFEGGFLGLDNIGVFDRSAPLPTGGNLEQADGTAWMALYCHNMFELSMKLTAIDPTYEDLALKFIEHFCWIAAAINRPGDNGMWDEEDGFYYDKLQYPDGSSTRLKVRSMVGLLPLCAITIIEKYMRENCPQATKRLTDRLAKMPDVYKSIHRTGAGNLGVAQRGIFALVNEERLRRILSRMLDENEFLGPYGIRALSKYHDKHPYIFYVSGHEYRVEYMPGESDSGMFGGNSNWRGPVWMPVNFMLIRSLMVYYLYYGDNFKIECPTGSGRLMNLFEVSKEISDRIVRTFLKDDRGRRPVYGTAEKFQSDKYWKDNLLFNEYFHGDTGAGIGANHQTGWTGLVAYLIEFFGFVGQKEFLEGGIDAAFMRKDLKRKPAKERAGSRQA